MNTPPPIKSFVFQNETSYLSLEQSDAFQTVVAKPYAQEAADALKVAKEEAMKPADVRNDRVVVEALRAHVMLTDMANVVAQPLADLRKRRADQEKRQAGKESLQEQA